MLLHPLRKFRFVSHSFARRSAIGPWRDSNIICRLSRNDALTLLGLNDDYTLLQVKKAYRLKIKLLHPDLGTEQSCEKKTVDLNLAYEVACKGKRNGMRIIFDSASALERVQVLTFIITCRTR